MVASMIIQRPSSRRQRYRMGSGMAVPAASAVVARRSCSMPVDDPCRVFGVDPVDPAGALPHRGSDPETHAAEALIQRMFRSGSTKETTADGDRSMARRSCAATVAGMSPMSTSSLPSRRRPDPLLRGSPRRLASAPYPVLRGVRASPLTARSVAPRLAPAVGRAATHVCTALAVGARHPCEDGPRLALGGVGAGSPGDVLVGADEHEGYVVPGVAHVVGRDVEDVERYARRPAACTSSAPAGAAGADAQQREPGSQAVVERGARRLARRGGAGAGPGGGDVGRRPASWPAGRGRRGRRRASPRRRSRAGSRGTRTRRACRAGWRRRARPGPRRRPRSAPRARRPGRAPASGPGVAAPSRPPGRRCLAQGCPLGLVGVEERGRRPSRRGRRRGASSARWRRRCRRSSRSRPSAPTGGRHRRRGTRALAPLVGHHRLRGPAGAVEDLVVERLADGGEHRRLGVPGGGILAGGHAACGSTSRRRPSMATRIARPARNRSIHPGARAASSVTRRDRK